MICPVFNETLDEKFVARSRITLAELLLQGKISDNGELSELWKSCIKCTRCAWICPSGARGDDIAIGIAALLTPKTKLSIKLFFKSVVFHRPLFDSFIKAASNSQKFLKQERRGVLRHLPLAIMGKASIPSLPGKPALHTLPRRKSVDAPRKKVGLFLGCGINYVFPKTAEYMVELLSGIGVETVIPKDQLCCGTPALTAGLLEEAAYLAKHNAKVFSGLGVDAIVTGCASCALTLRKKYATLIGKGKLPYVYEFSELLAEQDYSPVHKKRLRVAYHDPCHLRYGLGIFEQPREILSRSAELIVIPDEDKCCGGGGTFALFNSELSAKLAERKAIGIRKNEPDILTTTCPGCIMQLREHLSNHELSTPVIHLADFLAGRTEE